MKKPSIQQAEDFFPAEVAEYVSSYSYNGTPYGTGFRYGEGDGVDEDVPTGMVHDLYHAMQDEGVPISDEARTIYYSFVKYIHEKYPGFWDTYKIYRLYVNVFAPKEQAYFHCDCGYDVC